MAALPASIPEPARERIEADLAGYACDFDPRRLRIIAHRMLAIPDPDGPEPGEEATPVTPTRGELWLRDRRDGRLGLEGWLDPEHGSTVRALIEQLAARHTTTDDGVADTRTAPQRQADALIELCQRARAAGEFPSAGFPGCERPPGLCAAHHCLHWINGGETSVANCCLLCPAHHQQVHLQGWDITIRGGLAEFRPPAIIDPKSRLN